MPDQRSRGGRLSRHEPREVAELKQVKAEHPELAPAADLQIALLELQRRVQSRVPLPWLDVDPNWLKAQHEAGNRLLRFEDIPLDWTEFRLMFRQTADILRRFDALEDGDHAALQMLARTGHTLEPIVIEWYRATARPARIQGDAASGAAVTIPDGAAVNREALEQVLSLAIRPFLERCAEVIQQRTDFSTWSQPYCPLCGGEPEFGVIAVSGGRLLICGRCTGRWRFHAWACPFCGNEDRNLVTSFTSRDGRYRLYACDVCKRYLKAYDERQAHRPVMLAVDSVATLPLDAAAMQRGYTG